MRALEALVHLLRIAPLVFAPAYRVILRLQAARKHLELCIALGRHDNRVDEHEMFEARGCLRGGARDQMAAYGVAHAHQVGEVQFLDEQADVLSHNTPVGLTGMTAGAVKAQVHRVNMAPRQVLHHLIPAAAVKACSVQ